MTNKYLLLLGLSTLVACGTPTKPSRDTGVDLSADLKTDGRDGAVDVVAADVPTERGAKSNGATCAGGGECVSGYCADGVCCATECPGTCYSCKLAGSEGTCLAVPEGQPDERGLCQDQGVTSCKNNGNCDGKGACQNYAKGVICQAQRCVGSTKTNASTCDGTGTCQAGVSAACDPFTCDSATAACRAACNSDSECMTGNFCVNGLCGLLPPGAACGSDTQCKSAHCQQGVCCDKACTGNCTSCNLTGSVGTCTAVPDGQDPLEQCAANSASGCQQDGFCDGAGKCRLHASGTVCKAATCASGAKTLEGRCDGAGLCIEGQIQSCAPFICSSASECGSSCTGDAQCATPYSCQGGLCAKKANGQLCSSGTECTSGLCEQGSCCASACAAPCKSCSTGTCTNAGAGTDPKAECADGGVATCGQTGMCDGLGKCAIYSSGTQCKAASCPASSGIFTPASRCNGAGACVDGTASTCGYYVCNSSANACYSVCTTGGSECSSGNVCTSSSCGLKPDGAACTAGSECSSNVCAQGVCCKTTCTGTCMSCAVSGSEGTCSAIPSGTAAPSGQCTDAGAASCGQNGKCDGKGACALYASGSQCAGPTCAGGSENSVRTCNGSGTCSAATTRTCSPYICGTTACKNTCSSSTDCVSPYTCVNTVCTLKATGSTCTAGTECSSGICAQGRCCSTTCTGCKSCAVSGAEGTCTNLAAGVAPSPASTCAATAQSTCGLDGTCDGSGGCRKWSTSTQCAAATCPTTGSVATSVRYCDGNGTCSAGTTKACIPYMCNAAGTDCYNACTADAQCTTDNTCVAGSCGLKPNGSTCSAGSECQSTVCVDGYCCNDACSGTCKSCKLAGKLGTCTLVTAGEDPEGECTDQTASTCGTDGTCDGNGACRKYSNGTECTTGTTCSSNSTVGPSTCQSGTCTPPAAVSCGAYACSGGACYSACTDSTQCSTGYVCTGTTCGLATDVKLQYWGAASGDSKWIYPHLKLTNLASTAVPLSDFVIRYWFSKDTATGFDGAFNYTANNGATLAGGTVTATPNLTTGKTDVTADSYFDIGFTAGAGNLAGGTSAEVQYGFHDKNWAVLDRSNDFSCDTSGRTTFADWTKISVYRNGILVYGTEPN